MGLGMLIAKEVTVAGDEKVLRLFPPFSPNLTHAAQHPANSQSLHEESKKIECHPSASFILDERMVHTLPSALRGQLGIDSHAGHSIDQ